MRVLALFGIWAVAVIVCATGCGKGESARIDISEARPSAKQWGGADRTASVMAGLRRERAALAALRHGDADLGSADRFTEPTGASEEIARRISNASAQWREHWTGLASAPRVQRTGVEYSSANTALEPGTEQAESLDVPVMQHRHSKECLNWRMRVALLESRLAETTGSEQGILGVRLEQARAALKAADEACEAEMKAQTAASGVASPAASAEPGPTGAKGETAGP